MIFGKKKSDTKIQVETKIKVETKMKADEEKSINPLGCSCMVLLLPVYALLSCVVIWMIAVVSTSTRVCGSLVPKTGCLLDSKKNFDCQWRFLSISGSLPQTSGLFRVVISLLTFLAYSIGLLRFLQLRSRLTNPRLNVLNLVFYWLSCYGMTLSTNFSGRVQANGLDVRGAGVIICSCFGIFSTLTQSYSSFYANRCYKDTFVRKAIIAMLGVWYSLLPFTRWPRTGGSEIEEVLFECEFMFILFLFICMHTCAFWHCNFHVNCTPGLRQTKKLPAGRNKLIAII